MARLSGDEFKVISAYVMARYSHWPKKERKARRQQVIRALKREPVERIKLYIEEASEALERSGLL